MSNYIDRDQILEEFLKNIFRLSDQNYQERVWIRGEGPECNEIDDVLTDFFDDGDPILEEYKKFGINENQYRLLISLRRKLDDFTNEFDIYSSHRSTEKLVKMPQWEEIKKTAKEVLRSFNFKNNNLE